MRGSKLSSGQMNSYCLFRFFSTTLPQQLLFQIAPQLSLTLTSPPPPKNIMLENLNSFFIINNSENSFNTLSMALFPLSVPVGFRKLNHLPQRTPSNWWQWLFRQFSWLSIFHDVCCLELETNLRRILQEKQAAKFCYRN